MLRLVLALALGATTQLPPTRAFVVAPQHRLALPSYARGHSSSPGTTYLSVAVLPLSQSKGRSMSHYLIAFNFQQWNTPIATVPMRDDVGDGSSARNYGYGRPWRGNTNDGGRNSNLSMRVVGPRRRDLDIEGSGGETRRVRRQKRSRQADLRSIGLETVAAAAAVVVQEQGVDVQTEGAEAADLEQEGEEGVAQPSLVEKYEAAQGLRERAMMEAEPVGTVQDKYTKIYVPMDGVVIKKTYGFWTWQVFGLIFIQHFVRNIIRKGGSLKKTSMAELNWDHIVTEPEHLLELKAYCCEECGYTLFPARGRHEVFFDEVKDFKCPECDAPRSAFYDANDKDDPHNIKRNEELEAKAAAKAADGSGADVDGGGAGSVAASVAAGGTSSAAESKNEQKAGATPASTPPSASSTSKATPPESARGKSSPSPPPANQKPDGGGDDDDDDLLDF